MNDMSVIPGVGHNKPPIDLAPEDVRISALVANADEWAAEHPVIESAAVADAAGNWLKQLRDQIYEFTERFKVEKAPHEERLAEIRSRWHPRLNRLDACLKSINPRHRAWLKLDDARAKAAVAAEVRAAEEQQRRADQLAEQAKAGGPNAVTNEIAAREAAQEAESRRKAAAAMPARAQVRPSLGGPTISLRTVWRAEIIEQDECYLHFRNHKDVKALLQSLANAAARHGTRNPALPGCWIYSTQE